MSAKSTAPIKNAHDCSRLTGYARSSCRGPRQLYTVTHTALPTPAISATGDTANVVRSPCVVSSVTPSSASTMLTSSYRRGFLRAAAQATSSTITGDRSCMIVPTAALENWMVRKYRNWLMLTPSTP